MADTVKETIDVQASGEEICEVVTYFEYYPEWQPNFKRDEVKVTDRRGRPK